VADFFKSDVDLKVGYEIGSLKLFSYVSPSQHQSPNFAHKILIFGNRALQSADDGAKKSGLEGPKGK
jgi:hypothetical protein